MDYLGVMDDLFAMGQRAGRNADEEWLKNPQKNKDLNVFSRECFEFYKDIEELIDGR